MDDNHGSKRPVGGRECGEIDPSDSDERNLRWFVKQIAWRDWKDQKIMPPGRDKRMKKPGIRISYTTQTASP
jgi:hypothetical protein